jgi:dipeptidyl-peptidase-4
MVKALSALPTIDAATASAWGRRTTFHTDPARQGALFEYDNDLYYARFDGETAVRLTHTPGAEGTPLFSPDGKFVAFVRDHDLHVVDLATQTERALTTGGSGLVRHGEADWVYGEEIFNRRPQAFWWSPDSKRLALLEFDDTPVPTHWVMDDAASPRRVEPTPYPRAGEPNPWVRFGIVSAAGGAVRWADLAGYSRDAFLISHAGWWPDGRTAYCYVQDREQTWLDFVNVPAVGGEPKRLFRETTRAWVESPGSPEFLDDGSFLYLSERDGWKHLYHYAPDGTLKRQVTSGPWEVRAVLHAAGPSGWVNFAGTRDDPLAGNFYRVKLGGGPVERLTRGEGSHVVTMSPDGKLYLDSCSRRDTPAKVALFEADGVRVRTVDSNPVYALEEYRFGPRERVTIKARDGFDLEAEVTSPPELDPSKKYPVWLMTYAGPHMPTISEAWAGGHVREQALASEGVVVFRVDPRSASGKGAASAWAAYRRLGVQELEDLKDAVAWLVNTKPFVDPARVGIEGHSYGGYLTAFAMTHSTIFAAGIAGSPVTDWRDYDSIYSERYMGLPQDNPEGYDASSVLKRAKDLHGRLLIAHGAVDDNVSVRNTLRLVHALQEADKDFELMIYPGSGHGGFGRHFERLRVEFIRRTIGGPRDESPGTSQHSSKMTEGR